MKSTESIILKPNKLKNGLLFFVCAAFVALGVFLLDKEFKVAVVSIGFFGLGVIISLIQLHPNASHLKLTKEGVEVRSMFRSSFTKWSHITNLREGDIKGTKMILFDFTEDYEDDSVVGAMGRRITNNRGAVQSMYNISTSALLSLMNEYKEGARGQGNN
ncbi:MAG: STM3941 family protein [Bacteroidota bacterium]